MIAEAFHPSELIRDELTARGWTLDDLALRMAEGDREEFGIDRLALDFYFDMGPDEPSLRLGDHQARMIAAVFGVDADFFINLERAWLAWVEKRASLNSHKRGGAG